MIKRLFNFLFLLALIGGCAWLLFIGMPALEKLTPSKTTTASTATIAPDPVLATASNSTPTASMTPSVFASIKATVVAEWSVQVWAGPGVVADKTPVAWLYFGAEVSVDQCQHGWAHLAGGPGWVRSVWLDPDVCGGGD